MSAPTLSFHPAGDPAWQSRGSPTDSQPWAGYAVVHGVFEPAVLRPLAQRLNHDLRQMRSERRSYPAQQPYGLDQHEDGHLSLGLPRHAPWVSAAFVANPAIELLVSAILGDCVLSYCHGNTNCAATRVSQA